MNIVMIMAEDEIIDRMAGVEINRELIQRLILPLELILLVMRQTVLARPPVAEPISHPWMQKAEKELEHTIMESPAHRTITERDRPQTITMSETEPPPPDLNQSRLHKTRHPEFLEI